MYLLSYLEAWRHIQLFAPVWSTDSVKSFEILTAIEGVVER